MRRIKVDGTCDAAKGLRTLIARDATLIPAGALADVHITVQDGQVPCPEIDGIDGELERLVLRHIGELSPSGRVVVLFAAGTVHRDDQMVIRVPAGNEKEAYAVEHGVYRALLDMARPTRSWWSGR